MQTNYNQSVNKPSSDVTIQTIKIDLTKSKIFESRDFENY